MFFAPRTGWRQVEGTDRRPKQDFARCRQPLVDGYYPEAEVIGVVGDNLTTPTPAAWYETFPPCEAHRLLQREVVDQGGTRGMVIFTPVSKITAATLWAGFCPQSRQCGDH